MKQIKMNNNTEAYQKEKIKNGFIFPLKDNLRWRRKIRKKKSTSKEQKDMRNTLFIIRESCLKQN